MNTNPPRHTNRREFAKCCVRDATFMSATLSSLAFLHAADDAAENENAAGQAEAPFALRYILASCMYGYEDVANVMSQVAVTGCQAIDIWPKVHGSQREQLDEMGVDGFAELLKKHKTRLGCLTQYKLGPFGLTDEMHLAKRLGCPVIVTGGKGPKGLTGAELKSAVAKFAEAMKPHLAVAEETGVTIAIENHGNNLIESFDSMRWLMDLRSSPNLAIALAPYHLPQDSSALASFVGELGDRMAMFYAWQHGMGSKVKLPKSQELLQMPGRGDLDFGPIVDVLRQSNYQGWTEVFMHPVPRGIAILDTVDEVSKEINRGRRYLDALVAKR